MKITRRDWLLLVVVLYFTFIGGTFYSQFNFILRVANQLLVTALLGGWLLLRLRRREGLPRTALDLALALYVAVNFGSALVGQSPRYSLEVLWATVTHLLAFYLLVDLMRRGQTAKLVWAVYMASAVVCLVGLAEFLAWYLGAAQFGGFAQGWLDIGGLSNPLPPTIYRLNITLNGSTPLAAYLALLIPPAIGLVLTLPPRSDNRRALLIWLGLALIVQTLTFSRAGILALGVSLGLLLAAWLLITGRRLPDLYRRWQQVNRLTQATLIGAALLAGLLAALWLANSFTGRAGSTDFRLTLWQVAATVFQEQWLLGAGPGNFGRALLRLNQADLPRVQITTAHSLYFNTAAELGLLGLLAGALFYGLAARAWWRHFQQLTAPPDKIRLAAVGAALAGLAVQLLVDTYTATPNLLPVMGLLAYVATPLPAGLPRFRRWAALAGLLLLAGYLAGLLWVAAADWRFQTSLRRERTGNLPAAIEQAAAAQQLDPALTLHLFRRAYLEASHAAQTGDPAALAAAVSHYQAGLAREPVYGLNSANLAALLAQQGQLEPAVASMRRTLAADDQPVYWLNLGYFYEQQGDWPQAVAAYGQLLRRAPALAGSAFWRADPERLARWPDIAQQSLPPHGSPAQQAAHRLALALARPDSAAELPLPDVSALQADAAARPLLIDWHFSQNDLPAVAALLPAEPESAAEYLARGRLQLAQGEGQAAEQSLKTAAFLGDRQAFYYLGQLYEQQGDVDAARTAYQRSFFLSSSENESVTLYGRFGGVELAPQLIRIAGPQQVAPALALARLYQAGQRPADAARVVGLLRQMDDYLTLPEAP